VPAKVKSFPVRPGYNAWVSDDPTPFFVRSVSGCWIGALTVDPVSGDKAQIVTMDGTGKELGCAPVAIPGSLGNFKWNASVRLLPPNRLLWIGGGNLRLVQGEFENARWTWPIPGGSGAIVDIIPPGKEMTETIVIQAGTHVYGVDSGTGKTIWICTGPGRCMHVLPTASGLPRLLFEVVDPKNAANVNTVCRRAFVK
jgi:hypothetical protein